MSKITCNKLVRDGIPDIIRSKGHEVDTRQLDSEEYKAEAIKKVGEEAMELASTKNPEEVLGELGDILEITYAVGGAYGFTPQELDDARQKKLAERGGFAGRVFLESVTEKDHEN